MFENEHTSMFDDKYKLEYKLTTASWGFGKDGIISEGQVGGWYMIPLFMKMFRQISERNNKNPELDRFVEKIDAVEELLSLFERTWTHGKTVSEWLGDFNKNEN